MIETFNSQLLVVNFDIINDFTVLQLRTLLTTYLNQLAAQQGTINPSYKLTITPDPDNGAIDVALIVVFQRTLEVLNINLTYTSNSVYNSLTA